MLIQELLYIVVAKLKYDESYSWEHEGEDEAMFDEYRKELRVIVNNIGALVRALFCNQLLFPCIEVYMHYSFPSNFGCGDWWFIYVVWWWNCRTLSCC